MPKRSGSRKSKRAVAKATGAHQPKREQKTSPQETARDMQSPQPDKPTSVHTQQISRQNLLVSGLMGLMLILFVVAAFVAPDTSNPSGRPSSSTIMWRLVFLLVPLGVMYALLWWDRVYALFKRKKGSGR